MKSIYILILNILIQYLSYLNPNKVKVPYMVSSLSAQQPNVVGMFFY